jgi:hypothetical protein
MNWFLLIALSILAIAISASAQASKPSGSLTEKQWGALVAALEKEDWITAEKLSGDYLAIVKTDDDEAKTQGRLRYMYLYSAAGKVSKRKMTYAALEQRVKEFVGKEIVFPYRPVSNECHGADSNTICKGQDSTRLLIIGTNRDYTTIHDFEYVKLKEAFDFEKNDGKQAMIIGRVDSITSNPNRSLALILRIYVSDASVRVREVAEK